MMKIKDLATMELLSIDQPTMDYVQGGLGFSFQEIVVGIEGTEIITMDSQYTLLDNGVSSASVFTMVSTTPNSSISLVNSSSTVSIG
jgi:hypothetical protein